MTTNANRAKALVLRLTQFDASHGHVVTNALECHARDMREAAAECQAALDGTLPPQPAVKLDDGQVQRFREAADAMAVLLTGTRKHRDVQAGAAALLGLVCELILPGTPAGTISVKPTQAGVAGMARLFTDSADKSGAASQAYEELAETAETLAEEI